MSGFQDAVETLKLRILTFYETDYGEIPEPDHDRQG